jgi:hypothetical protein
LYLTQRATSCCLYKHRSWPIVIHSTTQSIEFIQFTFFCTFALVVFPFHLDLLVIASIFKVVGSRIFTVPTSLGRRWSTSSQLDDAPDCRWSRHNQSVRFLKMECPIFPFSSKSFRPAPIRFVWQHIECIRCC